MAPRAKKTAKKACAVQCVGCDRQSDTATGEYLWYCPPCSQMYWQGVQDGHALAQRPAALEAGTPHVTTAVVIGKKKAGRVKTIFCCKVPGCRQADKEHDFGSGFHLKQHTKNAHEEPRFGPCSRCGTKFKSLAGFNNHVEKQLDCVQVDPEKMYALTQVAPLVPATAPGPFIQDENCDDGPY
jgi:uncharacterized C2H2 Zn-finger protein